MSDLMMLPPLHNLRLGDSTGVSLEFAKVKQGGDEYMDDDIVKKPVDDFIDKNTASMALQSLIDKLKTDEEFLHKWRLSICDNITQKLVQYNGQTDGILDDIFKEQNLMLRLIDAFRRPVERQIVGTSVQRKPQNWLRKQRFPNISMLTGAI